MASTTISVSGSKSAAKEQASNQIGDGNQKALEAVNSLIDAGPGDLVSLSGSITSDPDNLSGTVSFSGTFWATSELSAKVQAAKKEADAASA